MSGVPLRLPLGVAPDRALGGPAGGVWTGGGGDARRWKGASGQGTAGTRGRRGGRGCGGGRGFGERSRFRLGPRFTGGRFCPVLV